MLNCLHPVWKNPIILASSASPFFHNLRNTKQLNYGEKTRLYSKRSRIVCGFLPVDPWAPNVDSQSIASQLFAFSLFPYVGFLYFLTKSKTAPKLTLFGFYFLLAFVGATIPAGIYGNFLSQQRIY
uniref:1-acyl-sn-glycerol-3-phosphate acyltransferase n=1 Tax=Solanum tuberosum TaxID=4113 RepID=M1A4Y2_SOLTU